MDDYIDRLFPPVEPDTQQNRLVCKLQSDFWYLKGKEHKAELQVTYTPDSRPNLRKVRGVKDKYYPRIEQARDEMRMKQEAIFRIYYPYLYRLICEPKKNQ